jgi:uncharacterized membrane protein HdeD (DUF308 family)
VSCDKPRSRSTREHWLAYLIEGILLVLLGAAAIVVPSWSVAIFLGWLFLLSGLVGLITTAPGFW